MWKGGRKGRTYRRKEGHIGERKAGREGGRRKHAKGEKGMGRKEGRKEERREDRTERRKGRDGKGDMKRKGTGWDGIGRKGNGGRI